MDDEGRRIRAALANQKTDGVIQGLREALLYESGSHEPWISGTIDLFAYETTLFYRQQDGTHGSLTIGSGNVAQVEDLSRACSPATFGLNDKEVLDETYRKAGKLDADKFGWLFNPSGRGHFLNDLASGLFPWCTLSKGIRFEPYKLNVYGEGSFFKAHQDTPRSEDMFGSLVVLLPVVHEGGNLRLAHRDREFIFDGQALLEGKPAASVAYVAFFSDVEHEVTQVTSGHRITITFNLYFDLSIRPLLPQTPTTIEHPFKTALTRVLQDPVIKATHQYLGFGLEHAYPFKKVIDSPDSIELKGSDAILIQTLNELDVNHRFRLLYREQKDNTSPFRILTPTIIDEHDFKRGHHSWLLSMLLGTPGTFAVWNQDHMETCRRSYPEMYSEWYRNVHCFVILDVEWVTEPSEETLDRSVVLAYGNEECLGYHYHQLCVIVTFVPNDDLMDVGVDVSSDVDDESS